MYIIFSIILLRTYALTFVDTYFNQPYELQYKTSGSYILSPKDYKYAPTIFVTLYGAGGGADNPRLYGRCKGQDGAYLTVLLDTHSGTTSFNVVVGKGGAGEEQINITGCQGQYPIIKGKNATNGGDSSIITSNKKTWAVAKGGAYGKTNAVMGSGDRTIVCEKLKGGYTNISFGYGIIPLERQNSEPSLYSAWFYHNSEPGYGGINQIVVKKVSFPPCARDYPLWGGGSGNDGLVRIIPVAVPINILTKSVDAQSVDINFYMRN